MGGHSAATGATYRRSGTKFGISGDDFSETLVNGKPLEKSAESHAQASSDFYRNTGAMVGGFEAGIGGAIVGGLLGSILDD